MNVPMCSKFLTFLCRNKLCCQEVWPVADFWCACKLNRPTSKLEFGLKHQSQSRPVVSLGPGSDILVGARGKNDPRLGRPWRKWKWMKTNEQVRATFVLVTGITYFVPRRVCCVFEAILGYLPPLSNNFRHTQRQITHDWKKDFFSVFTGFLFPNNWLSTGKKVHRSTYVTNRRNWG